MKGSRALYIDWGGGGAKGEIKKEQGGAPFYSVLEKTLRYMQKT